MNDFAEIQLQQELRSMFEVDTQKDLQSYLDLAQNLNAQSWVADIQKLYRLIHTIKGGAVTVNADAILHVAAALEDLLSDLRYLDAITTIDNDQLSQILLEGGELLASTISLQEVGAKVVVPKVERLQSLREQIQETYLPEWNEQAQLQREFAEQGFDLVVLDLEIALAQLPNQEIVPDETVSLGQQLIEQLQQIGQELQFTSGWSELLQDAQSLLIVKEEAIWRAQWPAYFQALKACAKQGGKPVALPLNPVGENTCLLQFEEIPSISELDQESWESEEMLSNLADVGELLDVLAQPEGLLESELEAVIVPDELRETAVVTLPVQPEIASQEETIQIPVPLERLNRSAEYLVDTLLAARATQGVYQTLHQQLLQLVTFARESVQYITNLRQIQDDYAVLDNLKKQTSDLGGPSPERYRKGYTTINRLLENSLRLSELGAETQHSARQTAQRLQQLDRHILSLRDIIEDSRLLPFKNICFRARAILRDLTNRYGKPAQLIVQGESIELDVGTGRALEPALLHLIRNAYDHGLESPAERIACGKTEQGTLAISLQRRGNTFLLTLQDDGRGIDAQAIQARALSLSLPRSSTQTPAELLAVLCQPGFSSQAQVSELSGRGVGMDVVAVQVARLGGQLSLDTIPGSGTTFSLKFPVPHLLVPCMLLQAGDRTFAIPTEHVATTALFEQLEAYQIEDSHYCYDWEIRQGATSIPGLDLLTYWHPDSRARLLSGTAICIYVRQADKIGVWLLADKLLGQSDLPIKPLPSPFISPNGLMGVSLRADGTLMPVLEVTALVEQLLTSPSVIAEAPVSLEDSTPLASSEQPTQLAAKILVVDDAALMRRRIEASLSAYGYMTDTCADGLEAWNWLQSHPIPALIITDIEMPNMDGFTLIERCREAGISIPILVISSRLAEEWGKEARRLGATNFLTKGFSTTELINTVNLSVHC